ncbi:DNA/RNA non-specific endonuclease [Iodobacter fluviatilis]|uniref:Endonuclease n=1 Tax=Iodobacter fluviatilis TaxID=537 RepID=A0A377STW3_9NEIS|nr:DNA/RNA non-specific endonuclease [Iodobacter fluviatilis]TCU81610.1 endonuclease G [Iodobacter fluviatilis]STR44790.1 Nuclease precursor [Iodobacter fluviatilis]
MRFPLIFTVALVTAGYLHFSPKGRHLIQYAVIHIQQIQAELPALSFNPKRTSEKTTPSNEGEFKACPEFFYNRTPPKVLSSEWKGRAICFSTFAVYHSGLTHTPLFVAERLNKQQLQEAQGEQRTNRFYSEARLPFSERATLEDYKGTGYDRGHMAPAGDMPTPEAMAQSFSLANMVPQAPENNRGVWAKSVEKAVRKYVMRASSDVYVITGPFFENGKTADPSMTHVWVPSALYKLVYDPTAGKSWAYWVDNQNEAKLQGVISYEALVKKTGIHFIAALEN